MTNSFNNDFVEFIFYNHVVQMLFSKIVIYVDEKKIRFIYDS